MQMDALGWVVTAFAILLTGVSKAGLGGALGGLAVPFMSMWISPRDAVAVVLPILIVMDMVGIRVWRGKAQWADLRHLIPAALLGIALGTLLFGVLSDRMVKLALGVIAIAFAADRLLRCSSPASASPRMQRPMRSAISGWGCTFASSAAASTEAPVSLRLKRSASGCGSPKRCRLRRTKRPAMPLKPPSWALPVRSPTTAATTPVTPSSRGCWKPTCTKPRTGNAPGKSRVIA
jgi:hypothetical protein